MKKDNEKVSELSEDEKNKKALENEKKIKREISRLKRLFKEVSENKKKLIEGPIAEAAFMRVSLEELKAYLIKNGFSVQSPQGIKKAPEADIYIALNKSYQSIMRLLNDLIDKERPRGLENGNLSLEERKKQEEADKDFLKDIQNR